MSDEPRSYRVPVLRLRDVAENSGLRDENVQDDSFDFTASSAASTPPTPAPVAPPTPPQQPIVSIASLPYEEPLNPVAIHNSIPPQEQIAPEAVRPVRQTPVMIDPNAPLRAPLTKQVDPFEKPHVEDPLDIWEQAAVKKMAPPPPKVPPQPAPAPVPPQAPEPVQENVPQPSAFTYGTLPPQAPPTPPASPAQTESTKTQALLNEALRGMGFGTLADTAPSTASIQEDAHGTPTRLDIQNVADATDERIQPVQQAPAPVSIDEPTIPVTQTPAPVNAAAGNLAALRDRVMRSGGGHHEVTTSGAPRESVALARARALAGSDVHQVQNAHSLIAGMAETTEAPAEVKHTPQTEHARALAGVAEALHAIQTDDEMPPPPSRETAQPSPLQAGAPQAPFVVRPATAAPGNEGVSSPRRTGVPMLRTFKSDVERTINHNQVSVIKMISDQETHRHNAATPDVMVRKTTRKHFTIASPLLLTISIILLVGAIALGVFISVVVLRPSVTDTVNTLFFANESVEHDMTGQDRTALLQSLTRIRDSVVLPFGQVMEVVLIERVMLNDVDTGQKHSVTGKEFMARVNARAPDTLLRTVQDSFIVGVHAQNKQEPFIVLRAGYHENAFAGMLLWEETMDVDLSPLFGAPISRSPQAPTQLQQPVGTSTASSTTPSAVQEPNPMTVDVRDLGTFDDETIANTPARVLRDADGSVRIVWAMPDTSTIIITTNPATFEEIRERMDAR